ncbi:MAG TPA: hypothetical protein DCY07_06445 [Rhodospirillaceae bacterium]|nr:hypothetical protein [Rhodospirillaceae bacterium]
MLYERVIIIRFLLSKASFNGSRAVCALCNHAICDQNRIAPVVIADWGHEKHLGCKAFGKNEETTEMLPDTTSRKAGQYSSPTGGKVYIQTYGKSKGRLTSNKYPRGCDLNNGKGCARFSPISAATALKRTSLIPKNFLQ